MLMKQIIDAYEVLDSTYVTGEKVKEYLLGIKPDANIEVYELVGPKGSTDMLKVRIPGKNGKMNGGDAPTIGLLGRLGGIGARPERIFWTETYLFPPISVRMLLQRLTIRFLLWALR